MGVFQSTIDSLHFRERCGGGERGGGAVLAVTTVAANAQREMLGREE